MDEAVFSTRITTDDGHVYDLSRSVTVDTERARRSIDEFAAEIRRAGKTASSVAFSVGSIWVEMDDDPQLFLAFDPAVSEEWVDTIRPLPDLGNA